MYRFTIAQFASDLPSGTWFIEEDGDLSLVVDTNDDDGRKVVCFPQGGSAAPWIRGMAPSSIRVQSVVDPSQVGFTRKE